MPLKWASSSQTRETQNLQRGSCGRKPLADNPKRIQRSRSEFSRPSRLRDKKEYPQSNIVLRSAHYAAVNFFAIPQYNSTASINWFFSTYSPCVWATWIDPGPIRIGWPQLVSAG